MNDSVTSNSRCGSLLFARGVPRVRKTDQLKHRQACMDFCNKAVVSIVRRRPCVNAVFLKWKCSGCRIRINSAGWLDKECVVAPERLFLAVVCLLIGCIEGDHHSSGLITSVNHARR